MDPFGWLQLLSVVWLAVGLAWFPCCVSCQYCTGGMPEEYQVEIAGVVNGDGLGFGPGACATCSDFNATWILPRFPGFPCIWAVFVGLPCGYEKLQLVLTNDRWELTSHHPSLGTDFSWIVSLAAPYDCETARSLSPNALATHRCNNLSATCTVTPL